MKIELQEPYSKDWRLGYLVVNKEPRRTVILFNSDDDRSSVSYARYLMSVNLGRYLTRQEQVDHVDNDKTNDIIENLQILTPAENNRKSSKGLTYYEFVCPICRVGFKLTSQRSHKNSPTCSRKCGYIKASLTLRGIKI